MTESKLSPGNLENHDAHRNKMMLFWACFTAIAATAAVFVIRGQVIGDWAIEFGLNETQKGEILGAGLWPFALVIILVSLVVDRIGYGRVMVFAFICHIISTVILLCANGYWWLYIGTFMVAVGNGAAQAVADPVVASMFRHNKTKWLNILHASWPAGMVAAGIVGIALTDLGSLDWRWRIAMLFLPILIYGVLMIGHKFPIHERVEAGVSDREMFREIGALGMLLVLVFFFGEIGRLFGLQWYISVGLTLLCVCGFGLYTKSLGQPMLIFLLLLMIPLATTELGTDSWITSLMEEPLKAIKEFNINPGWVLVYTSSIMMILRFCAGPVVRVLTPLGLLIISCLLATAGLIYLSAATGLTIIIAATLYGVGKTYLWPTMLGIVAERFPKGGALSLNATSAVGMISVGIVGTVFIGLIQDKAVEHRLNIEQPALHQQIVTEKTSVLGQYKAVDPEQLVKLNTEDQNTVKKLEGIAGKEALATIAIFPAAMMIGYIVLFFLFRYRGGYHAVTMKEMQEHE